MYYLLLGRPMLNNAAAQAPVMLSPDANYSADDDSSVENEDFEGDLFADGVVERHGHDENDVADNDDEIYCGKRRTALIWELG